MQFSIKPVNTYHYDIYQIHPVAGLFLGKTHDKTYVGSASISLDGNNIDLYCENEQMKNYSKILSKQIYSIYSDKISA